MENSGAQRGFLPDWFYFCRVAVISAARDDPVAARRDIADGKTSVSINAGFKKPEHVSEVSRLARNETDPQTEGQAFAPRRRT